MQILQQTIHLTATDEGARRALQTDGAAALAQSDAGLGPEEQAILETLADLLVLPASTLAERFQGWYLTGRRRWK